MGSPGSSTAFDRSGSRRPIATGREKHLARFTRRHVAKCICKPWEPSRDLLIHPTGNANVRAVLDTLYTDGMLERFCHNARLVEKFAPLFERSHPRKTPRNYALPDEKMDIHPLREAVRLLAGPLHAGWLTRHETGGRAWTRSSRIWTPTLHVVCGEAATDQMYAAFMLMRIRRNSPSRLPGIVVSGVFTNCQSHIWETAQRLLREEVERYPDWEPTLGGTRDSQEKLARKTRELELAELVICPSRFVLESLPEEARAQKKCVCVAFGSPSHAVG